MKMSSADISRMAAEGKASRAGEDLSDLLSKIAAGFKQTSSMQDRLVSAATKAASAAEKAAAEASAAAARAEKMGPQVQDAARQAAEEVKASLSEAANMAAQAAETARFSAQQAAQYKDEMVNVQRAVNAILEEVKVVQRRKNSTKYNLSVSRDADGFIQHINAYPLAEG